MLHAHRVANERARARFVNEVLLTRKLLHENIVRIFESGITAENDLYLVCEYVAGSSLAALLKQERLEFPRIVEVLSTVGAALVYAHGCGVLHRDLKPDNILVAESGQIKLADFGIARRLDSEERLTRTGESLGTPYYMAPEMIAGRNVAEACDIYAFGVLAYELSEGVRPFQGPTYFDLLRQHATGAVPPLSAERPAWFKELVQWCLEKEAARRPQSFVEVVEAIKRGVANEPQLPAFRRSLHRRRMRRFARPTAVAFFAILVLAGGGYWVLRSKKIAPWVAYPVLLVERESGVRLELLRKVVGWNIELNAEGFRQMIDLGHVHSLAVALTVWQGPLPKLPRGNMAAGYVTEDSDIPLVSLAAMAPDERSLELILEHGAQPNERSRAGLSALHWACMFGTEGSVKELLAYGADPNQLDNAGAPPLLYAVSRDMRHSVVLLLGAGARVDTVDLQGNTAVSKAIATGRATVLLMLLDHGAKTGSSERAQAAVVVGQFFDALSSLVVNPERSNMADSHIELIVRYLYRLGHVG